MPALSTKACSAPRRAGVLCQRCQTQGHAHQKQTSKKSTTLSRILQGKLRTGEEGNCMKAARWDHWAALRRRPHPTPAACVWRHATAP